MSRKYIVILNAVLIGVFAIRLYFFMSQFAPRARQEEGLKGYTFPEVKRPTVEALREYRNIFGVRPTEAALDSSKVEEEVIRLRGVFITRNQRHAVVSITPLKQGGREEVVRVRVGDKVRELTVKDILPGRIDLQDGDSNIIALKIFSR